MSDGSADRFAPRPVPPRHQPGRSHPVMRRDDRADGWPVWVPVVLLVLLVAVVAVPRLAPTRADTVDYGEFVTDHLLTDQVRTVRVHVPGGRATGRLTDGTAYRTTFPLPLPDALEQQLRDKTEAFAFVRARPPFLSSGVGLLVPLALLTAVLAWFVRRSERVGPRGLSGSPGPAGPRSERPRTTFGDIAGYGEVKAEIREIVDFLRDPSRFREVGAHIPKGTLLVGPPGTGKTLFARAVAGEASVPFFSVGGSDFVEMFVGVGASRVRELFATARAQAPCIVFVDEIDSLGRRRSASGGGGGHDEREQTLNQLLSELDGFASSDGIVVLAATNRPDVLDPALLRPGRFDRQVLVPLPELDERLAVLRVHCRDKPLSSEIDLAQVARTSSGMSGADLANLVNEAALHAVRRDSAQIDRQDFDAARERLLVGAAREAVVLSPADRRAVAVHEAGHALVALLLPSVDPVQRVSIVPRGPALGVTLQAPERDRHRMSEDELLDRIAVALAGRCAEALVIGGRSTGAADDLARVTALARRMVREWGMSRRIGPVALDGAEGPGAARPTEWSGSTGETADAELRAIVVEQERRCTSLLDTHRDALLRIADALVAQEAIDADELARLAGPVRPEASQIDTGRIDTGRIDTVGAAGGVGDRAEAAAVASAATRRAADTAAGVTSTVTAVTAVTADSGDATDEVSHAEPHADGRDAVVVLDA